MTRPKQGDIVLVDWRDARPKEPNKRRPAVVVEAPVFGDNYPNIIVAPIADDDPEIIFEELSVRLHPTASNGCTKACWIVGQSVTATSLSRISSTTAAISSEQLRELRGKIARAVGIS